MAKAARSNLDPSYFLFYFSNKLLNALRKMLAKGEKLQRQMSLHSNCIKTFLIKKIVELLKHQVTDKNVIDNLRQN